MTAHDWLRPDWPAPASVRACVTTRNGGFSQAPFDSLNLGDHVDDDPAAVLANRRHLLHAVPEPASAGSRPCAHACLGV